MIKQIFNSIKTIEKNILNFMFLGIKFSFIICIISALVLLFYILNPLYIMYEARNYCI